MALSGTVGQTVIDVMTLVEHGIRKCGKVSSQLSSEQITAARENLFFMLSSLANRGVPLWRVQRYIMPIYQGQTMVTLPTGTVDVLQANYRTLQRLDGSPASSAGGVAAYAFDGDIDTSCVQTSANGNISLTLTSTTTVTNVGVLTSQSADLTLLFESSTDGTTWTTVLAPGVTTYVDGAWQWYDINTPLAGLVFRMRETGGATLSIREFVVANTPTEIPMARLNLDQYNDLPNKTFQSDQPLQYWLDRARTAPVMNLWPAPADTFKQITVYIHRQIQDVGAFTNEVDVPQRWLDAIVAGLAAKMALEFPDVPLERFTLLDGLASRAMSEAWSEEVDDSPIMLAPNIRCYTA